MRESALTSLAAVRRGVLAEPSSLAALAVAMLALFVVAAAASSAIMLRGLSQTSSLVEHTLEVRDALRQIHGLVQSAESGHRGYLLTGEEFYLESMRQAEIELPRRLDAVAALISDNQEQVTRFDDLARAVRAKMATMTGIQLAAAKQSLSAARRRFDADIGFVQMRELSSMADVIVAEEEKLLAARQHRAQRQRALLVGLLGALFLSALVLGALAYSTARRQLRLAEQEKERTALLNAELEDRVRLRTADLDDARARAESEARKADKERSRVEILLRDLNHRVGNNLSMVSAVLGMQASRTDDQHARAALSAARERVFLIGSAQRRLRLGEDLQSVRADDLFSRVVDDILEALPSDARIEARCDFEETLLESRDAVALAVVLGELVTNSLKHAFNGREEGVIWADFRRNKDGVFVLTVSDEGAGIGERASQSGIGSLVINEMSRQFGGQVTRAARPGGGALVAVTLPGLTIYSDGGEKG